MYGKKVVFIYGKSGWGMEEFVLWTDIMIDKCFIDQ